MFVWTLFCFTKICWWLSEWTWDRPVEQNNITSFFYWDKNVWICCT